MDFLLHTEAIVIEAKMTRKNLADREVTDQLAVDIARYREHPRCKTLVCFVYDPDGYIRNPAAVAGDLEKHEDMHVRVFIRPDSR
jgi:hypothetical protein